MALIFCPADGPFGEVCTALATPALCTLVDKVADAEKKLAISAKRKGEELIGFKGQGVNPDVQGYESLDEIVKDAKSVRNDLNQFESEAQIKL